VEPPARLEMEAGNATLNFMSPTSIDSNAHGRTKRMKPECELAEGAARIAYQQ
jgi:hypothetical protein